MHRHQMKKLHFTILFTLFILSTKAQYVNIADTGFASCLRLNFPTAMVGSMLDTTDPSIVSRDFLDLRLFKIENLNGIQYFDSLTDLNCRLIGLKSIPALPPLLNKLDCMDNSLTSLPLLPNTLKYLAANHNKLISLPALPDSLTYLGCGDNELTSLPSLPDSLTILFCGNNKLTSFPPLPKELLQIDFDGNNISTLPALPPKLTELTGGKNKLKSIPNLPNSLKTLLLWDNDLEYIPNIPPKLSTLFLINNPKLNCLPAFTNDTFDVIIVQRGTGIKCLPKKVFIADWSDDSTRYLPICSPTSGCPISYNIVGNIHEDTSINCLTDSLNNGIGLKAIKVNKMKSGVLDQMRYSFLDGYYSFDANVGDSIQIEIDTAGLPFTVSCPILGKRIAYLTSTDSIFYNQDFGIQCDGVDFGVQSITGTFRRNMTRPVNIIAGDLSRLYGLHCGDGKSGIVTTTLFGAITYLSPLLGALTPDIVSGSTLTYNIPDFGNVDLEKAFGIDVVTDDSALVGGNVCITTTVGSGAGSSDKNLSNNTLNYCGVVVNSFDPNNKIAYPANFSAANEWITYTINFQNTGTDTAYHIVVRDTLDVNLDIKTFTFLASSHKAQVTLDKEAILFNFPHINLIDSFHDEPNSHGWLQYKIKTLSSFPLTSVIKNRASIYFDDNEPILTNTTFNANSKLSISKRDKVSNVNLYPNPANQTINIDVKTSGTITISDLLGRRVSDIKLHSGNNIVSINDIPSGLYLYQYISDSGTDTSHGQLSVQK